MALEIVWSIEAEELLKEAIEYLEKNWTRREIEKLFRKLEKALSNIANNPKLYKKSYRLNGTHECVISKHYSLFYTFDEKYVQIITFWNNYKKLN